MDFSKALAAIKDLENGADLASAIEAEISRLETKSYEAIGETRKATSKNRTLSEALEAIAKALGLEGDLESVLPEAESRVRTINSEFNQLKTEKTALETRVTTAEERVKAFERRTQVSEMAAIAGANPVVLERLLGDKLDELKVEGEGDSRVVKLGDKPLKEAIAQDEALKIFEAALFPAAPAPTPTPDPTPTPTPTPKLSNASPNGAKPTVDLVSDYMKRTYVAPKPRASAATS